MDTEVSYKTNLNTVKEMILDEEKIVTYITISKDLCTHVNNSKQLLCSAVQNIREDQPDIQLNINYIVSGSTANNTATTTICTESNLDKLQKSLNIVFFHHVYSVCKGFPGVDHAALLMLNKYEDYSLCPGIIRSKECTKLTSDEIGNLKTNSQEAVLLENKLMTVVNKKIKQEPKHVLNASTNGQVQETKAINLTETKIKVEVTTPKKDSNNKQNIHKINGLMAQKGITSFFNKSNDLQNNKKTSGLQNKNISNEPIDTKLKNEKMDLDDENDAEKEVINKKLSKKESKFKEEIKGTKKGPLPDAKNKIKKSSKVDKKRKRVLHVSDSEGDEDNNNPFVDDQDTSNIINTESDDEIPSTPSANSIKITSGIVNPKKRRKVVDKTYTDEDGYILTKKEEVYESCSENEDEIKEVNDKKIEKETKKLESEVSPNKRKKNSPKKSKKKISPPRKGKQPTLNSFFCKK